ncbi:MAG: T9SS type A sorting domain-containing protein, partial [Bacteroidota bacterium]
GFAVGNGGVLMKTENSGGVQIVGLDDVAAPGATLSVYPNPAREQVTLRWEEPLRQAASVRVLNALGQPVWSSLLSAGTTQEAFDVSGLSPGLYMVWLEGGQEPVTHPLLIVD